MAGSFEGVLANIPGYGGYLAKETYNRNQTLGDIQQMTGLQGLMAHMQQQQMAQGIRGVLSDASIPDDQKIQKLSQFGEPGMKVAGTLAALQKEQATQKRESDFRTGLSGLGGAPTQEQLVGLASKFGSPDKVLSIHQSSLDRVAATKAAREKAIEDRQSRLDGITMQLASREMEGDANRALRERMEAQSNLLRRDLATLVQNNKQEPAPSVTQIVDPTDPTKMLSIDARKYRGGGIGSAGVIGIAGKEPAAAKRDEQSVQGRETVSTVVGDLRNAYQNLQKGGGIVSTKDNGASNAVSALQSSGLGQVVGHVFGTENQNNREIIGTTRPLLLQAIKTATGMSAKQMDSNVELKMWLATATEPKLGLEANMHALDMLDKLYGTGGAAQQPARASGGRIGMAPKAPSTSDVINQADAILKGQ